MRNKVIYIYWFVKYLGFLSSEMPVMPGSHDRRKCKRKCNRRSHVERERKERKIRRLRQSRPQSLRSAGRVTKTLGTEVETPIEAIFQDGG